MLDGTAPLQTNFVPQAPALLANYEETRVGPEFCVFTPKKKLAKARWKLPVDILAPLCMSLVEADSNGKEQKFAFHIIGLCFEYSRDVNVSRFVAIHVLKCSNSACERTSAVNAQVEVFCVS